MSSNPAWALELEPISIFQCCTHTHTQRWENGGWNIQYFIQCVLDRVVTMGMNNTYWLSCARGDILGLESSYFFFSARVMIPLWSFWHEEFWFRKVKWYAQGHLPINRDPFMSDQIPSVFTKYRTSSPFNSWWKFCPHFYFCMKP